MLKLHTQQHIRFAKVEEANAFVVYAILVETCGNETVAISEPKIVKIIPKKVATLSGSIASPFALVGSAATISHIKSPVASPFATLFDFNIYKVDTGLGAQPPTEY
jgi:hypothetical protein